MKKTVRITLTKEFEIDIDDSHLTEESLKEFSSYMFMVDKDGLFKYVARSCFDEDRVFVEGVGEAIPYYADKDESTVIQFKYLFYDSETEIIE